MDVTVPMIAPKDLEKVAKEANSYKEVDGKFHVSQSYNPPLQAAILFSVCRNQIARPSSLLNMTMRPLTFFHILIEN